MSRKRTTRKIPDTISGQLLWYLDRCDLSTYRLSKDTGIDSGMLSRFLSGERGMSLTTVDKLAKRLGLRLVRDQD